MTKKTVTHPRNDFKATNTYHSTHSMTFFSKNGCIYYVQGVPTESATDLFTLL